MTDGDRLSTIIRDTLLLDAGTPIDRLSYQSIPEWDSVAHMSLIAAIEEEYGITIEADDIEAMNTVEKIKSVVSKYRSSPVG